MKPAVEEARRDAELYGVGFVVNGERVEPAKVVVFRNAAAAERRQTDLAKARALLVEMIALYDNVDLISNERSSREEQERFDKFIDDTNAFLAEPKP